MVNPWRGEAELVIDGQAHKLRLTLGALAELEATLKQDSLVALIARFETGDYGTRDLIALLLAGLKGGGWTGSAQDLLSGDIEGGPMKAAQVAAQMLARAFALPEVEA